MQIPINIPDDKADLVIDAICNNHGYREIEDGPTKAQFAKSWLIEVLKNEVASTQIPSAEQAARAAIYDAVRLLNIT